MTATTRPDRAAIGGPAPTRPRRAPEAPAPRRPPLRVVPPTELSPRARRRRARWLAAGVGLVVCGGLFGIVAFHVVLTQEQFRLDRLDAQVAAQRSEYDRLRLQVATLESPGRIVAEAQDRLGMVPPPSVRYLSPTGVSNGTSSGQASGTSSGTSATTAPAAARPKYTPPAASPPVTAAPARATPTTTPARPAATTTVPPTTAAPKR